MREFSLLERARGRRWGRRRPRHPPAPRVSSRTARASADGVSSRRVARRCAHLLPTPI